MIKYEYEFLKTCVANKINGIIYICRYTHVKKVNDKDSTIYETKVVKVIFQGEWESNLPYFDFDTDMALEPMSRALAREDWTKEYFKSLRE